MAQKLEKTTTPGIYRRGGRYVVVYKVHGRQYWESARTLEDARRLKAARTADAARGEFEARSRTTLHEYAGEWIDRYQGKGRRGFRENTRRNYRLVLARYVLTYFPKRLKLTEVTPSRVAGFVAWLCDEKEQARVEHRLAVKRAREAGKPEPKPLAPDARRHLSDSTVRNVMAPIRACLRDAVREGLLRSNPARDVDLPHRPKVEDEEAEPKALTAEELATLLAIVPDRWRTFFRLLAATGLRFSEATALQWKHLQLNGPTPHVKVRRSVVNGTVEPPKSRHGRRDVPIPRSLVLELRDRRKTAAWPEDDHLVFPSGNGAPVTYANLKQRVLDIAAEEAGVPWVGFHTFRHTCASMLFAEGRNAVQVQHWLGHHSAAFTLTVYVHLLSGDIGEPLEPPTGRSANPSANRSHLIRPEPRDGSFSETGGFAGETQSGQERAGGLSGAHNR